VLLAVLIALLIVLLAVLIVLLIVLLAVLIALLIALLAVGIAAPPTNIGHARASRPAAARGGRRGGRGR
jgi:hypothetical protein